MRSSSSKPSARRGRARLLALLPCAAIFACSLLAPNDDHFLGEARLPPPLAGESSGGRGNAGAAPEDAGSGGAAGGGEAGAAGQSTAAGGGDGGEASGGSGGDTGSACGEDQRDDAGQCVSISGCSDGAREAFLPVSAWPNLAGCTAQWPRASLRAPKTGSRCGFELGVCEAPADACGDGWHVCAAPPYAPAEISDQATAEECALQAGAYVAAVGDQFCDPCSDVGDGAACCGDRCVQQNGNCIYPGQTAWFGVYNGYKNVCGAIESDLVQRGVLCCRDH